MNFCRHFRPRLQCLTRLEKFSFDRFGNQPALLDQKEGICFHYTGPLTRVLNHVKYMPTARKVKLITRLSRFLYQNHTILIDPATASLTIDPQDDENQEGAGQIDDKITPVGVTARYKMLVNFIRKCKQ